MDFIKSTETRLYTGETRFVNKETIDSIMKPFNEAMDADDDYVVKYETVLRKLGFDEWHIMLDPYVEDGWGWTKNGGFHKLTTRELYDKCPCCGQPWPKDSD